MRGSGIFIDRWDGFVYHNTSRRGHNDRGGRQGRRRERMKSYSPPAWQKNERPDTKKNQFLGRWSLASQNEEKKKEEGEEVPRSIGRTPMIHLIYHYYYHYHFLCIPNSMKGRI